ncbi:MAG: permease-like cell division protein FtsX [Bernardetiaceae bacterium]|nr:permease-like cell division protein FtsX [Bernardetiaceae bacterium]
MARSKPDRPLATSSKRIGSYPGLTVVLSVSIALFLIGLFALFTVYAEKLVSLVQANLEVQVFLEKDLTDSARKALEAKLTAAPYLAWQDAAPRLRYVSKEEAMQQEMAASGEDFVRYIGDNPLRDSYIINLKNEFYQRDALAKIRTELSAQPQVYEVMYAESMIEQIRENIFRAETLIVTVAVILLVLVVVLIRNAIKLALFSQRFLIRSMQLVGASGGFIKRPFLLRAGLQGIMGGGLACLALWATLVYVNMRVPELAILQNHLAIGVLCIILLAIGVTICVVSAFTAVSRYLRLSLDQLN